MCLFGTIKIIIINIKTRLDVRENTRNISTRNWKSKGFNILANWTFEELDIKDKSTCEELDIQSQNIFSLFSAGFIAYNC